MSIETPLNIHPAPVAEQPASSVRFSGHQLAKNSLYNYAGLTAPLLVGLVSIPILLHHLGTERFGLLSLAWMVVGYFNVFDLGIGRATTKFVAEYAARNDNEGLCHVVWNALFLSLFTSIIGASAVALLVPVAILPWLNIPPELQTEARLMLYLLAAAVPVQLLAASGRGVLEARQRFDLLNAIRIPGSIAAFLVPLAVLPFTTDIFIIVAAILLAKTACTVVYVRCALSSLPQSGLVKPQWYFCHKLLSYGKWLTVSYIVAPLMGQADRFLIGSVLTMSAVAYYCTPFDLITKLFIIPTGMLAVLFPVFSAYSVKQPERLAALHESSVKYITIALLPIAVCVIVFARPFLRIWLDNTFAAEGTAILQVLMIGVLVNSVARVPLSAIEAVGRPDLTARMYLIEIPVYLAALYLATSTYGIIGAAITWTARLLIESIILFYLLPKVAPQKAGSSQGLPIHLASVAICGMGIAWSISTLDNLIPQIALVAIVLAVLVAYVWTRILNREERAGLVSMIGARLKGATAQ